MPHRENNGRPCWSNTSRNALSFVTQDRTKGFLAPLSRGRHTVPVREVHRSRKSDEPIKTATGWCDLPGVASKESRQGDWNTGIQT